MPFTITTTNSWPPPAYKAGDILVATTQAYYAVDASWTQAAKFATSWSYDALTAAYYVATGTSDAVYPFAFSGFSKIWCISGGKKVSYTAGHGGAWSSPNPETILAVPGGSTSALRLTMATAYGSGGNPPFNYTPTVSNGTVIDWSNNGVAVQGTGSSSFTLGGDTLTGGNLAWATFAIEPAPASGFFAMF